MAEQVKVEVDSGVATWTMGFAPVNALDDGMLTALEEALDEALADPAVCVVVLTSALKVFSAGADASWMLSVIEDAGTAELLEKFNAMMDRFREFCSRLHGSRLLSIAAIDGHALAGGLELAAACDLRFAPRRELRLGVPEMKLFGAMPSGGGGVPFLTRIIGASTALLLILEGEPVSPPVAYQMGLVDRLVDDGTAAHAAVEFARRISAQAGPVGLAAAKTSVMRGRDLAMGDALVLDRSLHWDAMRRGRFLDGVEKFARDFG